MNVTAQYKLINCTKHNAYLGRNDLILQCNFWRFLDCYDGWLCYHSSCLKLWHIPLTWPQAAEACSNHGSHLLSIESDDKELWHYLYDHHPQRPIFTGLLSSPSEEGSYSYRWSDGSPFVFSNWEHLYVHCKAELCTAIIPDIIPDLTSTAYVVHWSPVACSSKNIFICKKPKSERVTFRYRSF